MLSGVFPHEILKNQFADYSRINDKISYEISKGSLIQLRRGWYTTKESIEKVAYQKFNAANLIYGPSYISMFSALDYWQLIPERVRITESMTLKRKITINTPVGVFKYYIASSEVFSIGLKPIRSGNVTFIIANPAKALCDVIWSSHNVQFRSQKDAKSYLIEDLRISESEFFHFDMDTLNQCVVSGKKKDSLSHIIKVIKDAV